MVAISAGDEASKGNVKILIKHFSHDGLFLSLNGPYEVRKFGETIDKIQFTSIYTLVPGDYFEITEVPESNDI